MNLGKLKPFPEPFSNVLRKPQQFLGPGSAEIMYPSVCAGLK